MNAPRSIDPAEAERVVRRVADDLTAALQAKIGDGKTSRHDMRPYVDFWIGGRDVTVYIRGLNTSERRKTLAEAVEWARQRIADIPDPHACDPWFDPTHPLNRPEVIS